jgi:hypothetical protein
MQIKKILKIKKRESGCVYIYASTGAGAVQSGL